MRQGKSVDIFSFGLVLFYCLSGGRHPFGESYERDFNILQVSPQPLAFSVISHLLEVFFKVKHLPLRYICSCSLVSVLLTNLNFCKGSK